EGNVIAANGGDGILIGGHFNRVEGNRIGVNVQGVAMGNGGRGVMITTGGNNTIGGTAEGAGNIIAHNGSVGVEVFAFATSINNAILTNAIYDNGALGINLFPASGPGNGT